MKRLLIILALAALVALPLIITGCTCGSGGGAELTATDIATIKGFPARLDAHDSSIAEIKTKTDKLTTDLLDKLATLSADTLGKLAALDTAGLTALLNLDLATVKTDVTQLKTDVTSLITKVTALENGGSGGSSSGSPTSGKVTVILDVAEEPYLFTSTTASQVFPVKIINGTSKYQKVKFNLTLQCVSGDGVANVTVGPTVTANNAVPPMTITYVPDNDAQAPGATACQLIYATWADPNTVLVAPGKETVVYVQLTAFTTATPEVWQAMLSGVITAEL